jgi:hypothetical protein
VIVFTCLLIAQVTRDCRSRGARYLFSIYAKDEVLPLEDTRDVPVTLYAQSERFLCHVITADIDDFLSGELRD